MAIIASESIKAMVVACHTNTRLPSHKLSEQFGIGSRTIREIIKNAKDGVCNHGAYGRPPSLDAESQTCIKEWIRSLSRNRSPLETEALIVIIKREAHQTFIRRHPNYVHRDRRRKNFLSYRSLKKYQKTFALLVENI